MKKTLFKGMICAGTLMMTGFTYGQTTNTFPLNGNVGIGTTNPQQKLHVEGQARLLNMTIGSYYAGDMISFNSNMDGSKTDGNTTSTFASQLYFDRTSGYFMFRNCPATTGLNNINTLQYPLLITKEGNTSIGSGAVLMAPQAKLHVFDNAIIGPSLSAAELLTVNANFTTTTNSQKLRLFVNGIVGAKEFRCSLTNWADDVFNSDYKLKPLNEVESFIKTNKHLPEVPSEKEVTENGLEMGEMMKIHMKKIEELTLYMIELQKQNEKLAAEVAGLKSTK